MICTVMGGSAKPWDIDGRKGISYKISVICGDYPVDDSKGIKGFGEICETYKCDERLYDSVQRGDVVNLDIDMSSLDKSGYYRVKSAMMRVDDVNNLFSPI